MVAGNPSRLDKYRPNYLSEFSTVDDEDTGHDSEEEYYQESQAGQQIRLQTITNQKGQEEKVIEADPAFSSTAVTMVFPTAIIYVLYLLWVTSMLYAKSAEAQEDDSCGKGELWWILFTAIGVAWSSSCIRLCNPQTAHDMALFGATGSPGIMLVIRNAPEALYASLSALCSVGLITWSVIFIRGMDSSCHESVENLGLYPCFFVTILIQAIQLWYWLWCFLFTMVPGLRKMGGKTTGRVKLKESVAAEVRIGEERSRVRSSAMDDGRGRFVALGADAI